MLRAEPNSIPLYTPESWKEHFPNFALRGPKKFANPRFDTDGLPYPSDRGAVLVEDDNQAD